MFKFFSTFERSLSIYDLLSSIKQQSNSKRIKTNKTIPIVIIESHSRGLEVIQSLIRNSFLNFHFEQILHVDSHPDMMLPNQTLNWNNTEEVYEYMESSIGGIAEWLLPIYYLNHCNQLAWIRPIWSDQLADAVDTELKIGVDRNGLIKLKGTNEAYFVDENLVSKENEILNDEVKFSLSVCMANKMKNKKEIKEWVWFSSIVL